MSKQVLLVNFKVPEEMDLSDPETQKGWAEIANAVADFRGIRWKVWTFNEETREGAGIYLFDDEASLKEYLNGPTIAQVKSQLRNVSIKQFGVMEELTEITRGPIK